MYTILIGTGVGCVMGNYLYQAFKNKDYSVAFERSFFQIMALLVFGLISAFA